VARALSLALMAFPLLAATASAQDVGVLAPPEMQPILPADERPEGADQLRLGVQLDVEREIALLPFNFGGSVVYRPAPATLRDEGWLLRPVGYFRLRSPGKGTEPQVARRTVTSGGELELGLGAESIFRIVGILSAYVRLDGALMVHQASVAHETMAGDDQDRLLTAGLARAGPGAGLIIGPVLVGADLYWHWLLFGAETFPVFEETVTDGPRLGVMLITRLSSHLFAHFRILPSTEDVLPPQRWTVGLAASFDPFTD